MLSAPLADLRGVQDLGAVEITPLRKAVLYIKCQNIMKGQRGNIDLAPRLILYGVKDAAWGRLWLCQQQWDGAISPPGCLQQPEGFPYRFRDCNASKTRLLVFTYRKSQCEEEMGGGY